jgi:hypothetical protein
MTTRRLGVVAVAAIVAAAVWAARSRPPADAANEATADAVRPGAFPSAVFAPGGRLWAVWVEDGIVVSSSTDRGRTFAPPVRVTPAPEPVDANGEARPKIAIGPQGDLYVSWTRKGTKPYTGDIRFAASDDGGRTFSAPRTINDDGLETGHRFDTLRVGPSGDVYLAWIDKRDLNRAEADGRPYIGAAIYYTRSTDRGRTFAPNRKIKDEVCECCRLAVDFDGDRPVFFWRDIIDRDVRDHAVMTFLDTAAPGVAHRAVVDGWAINACPHHGPSLSIGDDGIYHAVWFTGEGPQGRGSFYARSADRGQTFSAPTRIAAPDTVGHAAVLSRGARVVVAWNGGAAPQGRPAYVMESPDGGATWSSPRAAAWAAEPGDHPFLLAGPGGFYLSWSTPAEGYRLVPLQ